jgi:drug/metabolite transporter (DMT)-like permease
LLEKEAKGHRFHRVARSADTTKMTPQMETTAAILAYSLCSGTLVLLNKLILHHLPYPSLVVCFQLAATIAFIYAAKYCSNLDVDDLKWKYILPYLYYIVAFALGVYCNMKSLSISNVETVIVFRALSPCIVAFLDALFLGRDYPSMRSWMALLTIVAGAYGYASYDAKFQAQGWAAYGWPICYLFIISFEMAYGKQIIGSVDLKTKSGPVLYTNLLGFWPMLLFAYMGGEPAKFKHDRSEGVPIAPAALIFLVLGCVVGTGIGYSSWWCRGKVSATSFTIIGVMNKCLTILLNLAIWDKHAPPAGIASLVLCLVGGTLYQQAPMRTGNSTPSIKAVVEMTDDVWEDDISGPDRGEDEDEPLVIKDGMKLRK